MNTLVMSGSIRSSQRNLDKLHDVALHSNDVDEFAARCQRDIENGSSYCNSDILTGVSLLAMHQEGVTPIPFSLARLFPYHDSAVSSNDTEPALDTLTELDAEKQKLFNNVADSSGIILVSPVYFGDRSSVANKVIQLAGKHNLFKNKFFGAAAVGAKRNGGQETTIIYCLLEALRHGAFVVGNGPPTSQYGGTTIGGHRGTAANDIWGLTTTYGVASRVAQLSQIYTKGCSSTLKGKTRILILVTMDNSTRTLLKTIKKYISKLRKQYSTVEFIIIDVLSYTIYRCLGCKSCPGRGPLTTAETLSTENHAGCIISKPDDGMPEIQKELIQADGVLVAGLNSRNAEDIIYRYQALIERSRYIRRDNFELTNKLFSSFTLSEVGATVNPLHHVKTVTSYIRHNVAMCRPVEFIRNNNKTLVEGWDAFHSFIKSAEILKTGQKKTTHEVPIYTTSGIGGYE